MIKRVLFKATTKLAELFSDTQLNGSLCLIFNGMASMIAIVFLVLFAMGRTGTLLWLGFAGGLCMILANITDLFPFWLKGIAKKLSSSEKNSQH
jgi:hypothetical protein